MRCRVRLVRLFRTAQVADAPRRENPSPPAHATEHPAYPLVIRIDHSALAPLEAREINHRGRVDTVVLGTHAVGESHTRGAISVLMIPDRNDASFDLRFQGRTHVSTVGTNGPALIYSHTDTDFVCTRQISFHPRQGFVAVASTVVADTQLVYDGFGSSRGRLGRRLISRVAERRAGESQEEARQIAARDTEHKLLQAFDKRLNAQLTTMNQSMNVARYVNLFMGEASAMQLSARSSKDCIYVGVGHKGSPARLTAIPPRRAAAGAHRDRGSLNDSWRAGGQAPRPFSKTRWYCRNPRGKKSCGPFRFPTRNPRGSWTSASTTAGLSLVCKMRRQRVLRPRPRRKQRRTPREN